jgi:ABC-type multidrug transport system ATPase subunit
VARPDALRNRLGYLPQDFGVYRNVTALEFMRYFAALKGVRDPGRIRRLLELVNLHDQAGRMASTFSGGMLRRLGIAQALLNDPDVLVVDEPTAGLDPEERLRFRNLLADLGADKLVIISTHIVSDVETIAGRLAIMRSGRLVACDTPDAILGRARGQVWSASVAADEYEFLRTTTHVLQALRQGERTNLHIAHPTLPCGCAGRVRDHARPHERHVAHVPRAVPAGPVRQRQRQSGRVGGHYRLPRQCDGRIESRVGGAGRARAGRRAYLWNLRAPAA